MVQWYVGLIQRDNKTPVSGRQFDAVARLVARRFGNHTTSEGRGRWEEGGKLFREPSLIFTTYRMVSEERGCKALHRRAKALAAQAAKVANQSAVLAVTTCADGHREADFVSAAKPR